MTELSLEHIEEIKKTIEKWSDSESIMRACEELNELSIALLHFHRGRPFAIEQVRLEMADVKIALKHLELKYGGFQKELDYKMKRMEKRNNQLEE